MDSTLSSVGFLTPLSSQIHVGHHKPSVCVGHSIPFYVGFLLKPKLNPGDIFLGLLKQARDQK